MSLSRNSGLTATFLLLAIGLGLSGCAYYNYYFNARKYFEAAEKQRQTTTTQGQRNRSSSSSSGYAKSIASAEKMLEYYPGSRWEDDAILLIAKANYRDGKYRSAAGRADELIDRYPNSLLVEEAELYKGLSLLRLAQPDSARKILGDIFLNTSNSSFIAIGHYGLGEYYLIENRPEPALIEFRAASQAAGEDLWLRGESWVRTGKTLGILKRYGEAVEFYAEILAEKIPRKLRFEANFQRAIALRECGRSEEAFQVCKELLKDGAFVDEFPKVELEAAKSLRELGKHDEARERLEALVEVEKRGEVGAEGQYLLGLLRWQIDKSDTSALSALQSVKSTERTASVVPLADSLIVEIEALSKSYLRLRFLNRQLTSIDSAKQALKQIFPSDTIWVDSTQLLKLKPDKSREKTSRKKSLDKRGKDRFELEGDPNDPIRRMVEEAMAADPSGRANLLDSEPGPFDSTRADSVTTSIAGLDTLAIPLDSSQLAVIDSLFRIDRQGVWLSLAELHLFDRYDFDSAGYYIDELLQTQPDLIIRARGIAAAAFMAKSRSDTVAYDSLYSLILADPPNSDWQKRAESALRMESKQPPATRAAALIDSAETIWRDSGDAETARLLYLLAAEIADSGDTIAARGLLAAAFITRTILGQDSLANQLYADVSKRYSNTATGKIAKKRSPAVGGRASPRPVFDDAVGRADRLGAEEGEISGEAGLAEESNESNVFEADKVDEPPVMLTAAETVQDYLRSYYPFEAYADQMNGNVELRFIVRSHGEVTDLELVKADPEGYGFDEAAMQVVALLSYRPGRYRGMPVDVWIKQSFNFRFPDN